MHAEWPHLPMLLLFRNCWNFNPISLKYFDWHILALQKLGLFSKNALRAMPNRASFLLFPMSNHHAVMRAKGLAYKKGAILSSYQDINHSRQHSVCNLGGKYLFRH